MDKKNTIKMISAALFSGAIWGLIEATLGYIIHFIPTVSISISGAILFPIGLYFMYIAYEKTRRIETILYVGLITAMIKLSDFLLPVIHHGLTVPMVKIVSPAIAIIFEASFVYIVLYNIHGDILKFNFWHAVIAAVSWRILFVAYQSVLFITGISKSFINAGILNILQFIFVETAINSVIIFGMIFFFKKNGKNETMEKYNPVFPNNAFSLMVSVILFFSTIAVNLILKLG
jgi:hypothetical protein